MSHTPLMNEAMKAGDFKKCKLCSKGMMHTGVPLFYRVKIECMGIDTRAVQQAHGMEQFMAGHVGLARVFHDPEIAKPIYEGVTVLVCQSCAMKPELLARLVEQEEEPESSQNGKSPDLTPAQ